jgi:hypothetical protein
MIGRWPCPVPPGYVPTDEKIVCTAPEGYGDLVPLVVTVCSPGGLCRSSPSMIYSYDPPIINSIVSSTPNANGALVKFLGKNFGSSADNLPIAISIGNLTCTNPILVNDGQATCRTQLDIVGAKNLTFLAGNRTAPITIYDFQSAIIEVCIRGYYGVRGQPCTPCPIGAFCPGDELDEDRVTAVAGFWRTSASGASRVWNTWAS